MDQDKDLRRADKYGFKIIAFILIGTGVVVGILIGIPLGRGAAPEKILTVITLSIPRSGTQRK